MPASPSSPTSAMPQASPAVASGAVASERAPSSPSTSRHRVDSTLLLRGGRQVEIDHQGQCYLLRVTRENKLILTK